MGKVTVVVIGGWEPQKKPHELYGAGPEGKTYQSCTHILHMRGHRMHKCEMWLAAVSVPIDIKLSWPACREYEEKDDEVEF